MVKRQVWRKVPLSSVPQDRRLIGSTWVFKRKRNGVYCARLVGLGYSQVPGIDYTDNFAPVVNDVTFRIILVLMLVWDLEGVCIDVETAFLYGELDEEIYMRMPEGIDEKIGETVKDQCVILERAIYGLVQAARQWWKRFVKELKNLQFQSTEVDPCLLYRNDRNGIVIIAMYVDDCLCIGTKQAIDQAIADIKSKFAIKVDGTFKEYLGCEVRFSRNRTTAWLGQPHLISNMERKFGQMVGTMRT